VTGQSIFVDGGGVPPTVALDCNRDGSSIVA
jgi:hypothetical protein